MKKALVLIAEGSEELEAVTIIDILRRAKVEVVVAGLSDSPITASRGVRLIPDRSIEGLAATDFDVLVLPGGGAGTEAFAADARVLELVRQAHAADMYLAAICAAPKVLLEAGVLQSKQVTSFPGVLAPKSEVYNYVEEAVVEDGQLITSRGPGTAMDFALKLVERLGGYSARRNVEAGLVRS